MNSASAIGLGAAVFGVLLRRWGVSRQGKPGGVLDGAPAMTLAAQIAAVGGPALVVVGLVAAALAPFLNR